MSEKQYAQGFYGHAPSERAPDFIVGSMSVKVEQAIEWLQAQEPDGNGFVRLSISRQKANPEKWSFSLDTWKPKNEAVADDPNLPF